MSDRLETSPVSAIVVFPFQASQVHISLAVAYEHLSCCKPHAGFVIFMLDYKLYRAACGVC